MNAVDYQNCLEPSAHFKTAAIPFHHEKEQMGIDNFRYLKHDIFSNRNVTLVNFCYLRVTVDGTEEF